MTAACPGNIHRMAIHGGRFTGRVIAAVAVALLFGFASFWTAALAGMGFQDTAVDGARAGGMATFAIAAVIGLAGMAIALAILGRGIRTWWLTLGAAPPTVLLLLNIWLSSGP